MDEVIVAETCESEGEEIAKPDFNGYNKICSSEGSSLEAEVERSRGNVKPASSFDFLDDSLNQDTLEDTEGIDVKKSNDEEDENNQLEEKDVGKEDDKRKKEGFDDSVRSDVSFVPPSYDENVDREHMRREMEREMEMEKEREREEQEMEREREREEERMKKDTQKEESQKQEIKSTAESQRIGTTPIFSSAVTTPPGSDINNLIFLQNYNTPNKSSSFSSPLSKSHLSSKDLQPSINNNNNKINNSNNYDYNNNNDDVRYFENSNKFFYEIDNSRIIIGKFHEPSFSQDEEEEDEEKEKEEEKSFTSSNPNTGKAITTFSSTSNNEKKEEDFSLTFEPTPPSSPERSKNESRNSKIPISDSKLTKKTFGSNDETADSGAQLTNFSNFPLPSSTSTSTSTSTSFSSHPPPLTSPAIPLSSSLPPNNSKNNNTTTTSINNNISSNNSVIQESEGSQFSQQPFVFFKPKLTPCDNDDELTDKETEPVSKRRRITKRSSSLSLSESENSDSGGEKQETKEKGKKIEKEEKEKAEKLEKGEKGEKRGKEEKSMKEEKRDASDDDEFQIRKQTRKPETKLTSPIKKGNSPSPEKEQRKSPTKAAIKNENKPKLKTTYNTKKHMIDDVLVTPPRKGKSLAPNGTSWTKAKKKRVVDSDDDDFQADPFTSPIPSSPCIAVPLHTNSPISKTGKNFQLKKKMKDEGVTVYDLDSPVSQIYVKSNNIFFEGVTFIFTGLPKGPHYESLVKMINSHGGKIGDFSSPPSSTSSLRTTPFAILPAKFLVADKERRTLKYLLAIATGTPCVQPTWVRHCCEQGCILPYVPYLLPAGYSLSREEVLYITLPKNHILQGFRVKVIGPDDFISHWETVIHATGASVLKGISNDSKGTTVIVSDPFPDQEAKKTASSLKIPIVSVEWVIQCLINQVSLPFDGHPRYHYMYLRDHYTATGASSISSLK